MATSRREISRPSKDMDAILTAERVENKKALQRLLYRRAGLTDDEIAELQRES